MKNVLTRIRYIIIGVMCIVCIISYLTIFRPIGNDLKENNLHQFIHSAEAVWYATELFIENSMNTAHYFSDKAELKQSIIEYKAGNITLKDLMEHTKQYYKTKDIATGAARVVDGNVIASLGNVDLTSIDRNPAVSEITPFIDLDSSVVTVFSPIKIGEEILGYDIIYLDLPEILQGVHQGHMFHEIFSEADLEKILSDNEWTMLNEGEYIVDDEKATWYIKGCKHTDVYFAASSSNDTIYGRLDTAMGALLFYFPLVILILILIANAFTYKNIGRTVKGLEKERDEYKKGAHIDGLTNTYSRIYLSEYIENFGHCLSNKPLCVSMIDVNKFKYINDEYGHLVGDHVLVEIASILKSTVRDKDMVVRFGGDEFLLLLSECSIKEAEAILERCTERIRNIDKFDFKVTVSYGIAEVENKEGIPIAIHQADMRMYQMKRSIFV
ncbi:MAG: GGDEF domain-containing protein [Clostridiales bacterium]|nr:GGDEF domain-containing protein [Clostridiales bacterium]